MGCSDSTPQTSHSISYTESDSSHISVPEQPIEINVAFVGDLMMHRWQIWRAYNEETALFDFSNIFSLMEPYFAETDYLVGNLETTFAGYGNGRSREINGYSCYPHFNSPDEYAAQMKRSGFDMLTFANNHTLDSRFSGICRTLNLLDSLGIAHTGAYRTLEESKQQKIVDIKGIKIGFCAYTFSLNGIRLPDSLSFAVNEFVDYNPIKIEKMKTDIIHLKKEADFVCAIVHFGNEYQAKPNNDQKFIAETLIKAGADAIIGSHPHVVQNVEIKNGIPVFYSLGNFLSSQRQTNGVAKDVGLYTNLRIVKWMGKTRVKRIDCIPTYVYWQHKNIGVLPVLKAHSAPSEFSFLSKEDTIRINYVAATIENTLFNNNTQHFFLRDKFVIKLKK